MWFGGGRYDKITFGNVPLKEAKDITISQAQILALFTTPVLLVAANPRAMYIPRRAFLSRAPGTAYTTAAALVMTWGSGGNICMHTFDLTPLGTGPVTTYMLGPSFNGTSIGGAAHSFGSRGNLGIFLSATTANPAAGTGSLTISLWYEEVPPGRVAAS